jgi:hypothetical protein
LLAASNGGRSPFFGFLNCHPPQLSASHFSQLQEVGYTQRSRMLQYNTIKKKKTDYTLERGFEGRKRQQFFKTAKTIMMMMIMIVNLS